VGNLNVHAKQEKNWLARDTFGIQIGSLKVKACVQHNTKFPTLKETFF
jgi:hypothetical protein